MENTTIRMAIAYDFDGTLSAGNMQEYDFIPALNMTSHQFWEYVNKIKHDNNMDGILAYMYAMLESANKHKIPVKKADFNNFGKKIKLFEGVETWFSRINTYAQSKNVQVEHFVISSGLREMIEGTTIHQEFKQIYASGFMFDHNGVACWPALAINYTNKTQFLFRINKGSLDVFDDSVINKYVPESSRSIPFTNIVFIGDGETDVPCMRLVKDKGGHSIAVYNPLQQDSQHKVGQLITDGRANLITTTNYQENSEIEKAVKAIIDKLEATSRIK
jgi:phosphoserine phosphatase